MRQAFTLVEVLLAVAILAVVGVTLLSSFANQTKLIDYLSERKSRIGVSSIAIHQSALSDKSSTIHFDSLVQLFNVEDKLRRELKDIKASLDYEDIGEKDTKNEVWEEEFGDQEEVKEDGLLSVALQKQKVIFEEGGTEHYFRLFYDATQ
jgi:prepilin-type N-terminal cleavage/methylation domain-containing protein